MAKTGNVDEIIIVIDTSYALHYPYPDQTDWRKTYRAKRVRLVATTGLFFELDGRKADRVLGDRAAKWIKLIIAAGKDPQKIKDGVTLERHRDPAAGADRENSVGDANIIRQALIVAGHFAPTPVYLATDDYALAELAGDQGVVALDVDRSTRLPDPQTELQKELLAVKRELLAEKKKLPDVRVTLFGDDGEGVTSGGTLIVPMKRRHARPFETLWAEVWALMLKNVTPGWMPDRAAQVLLRKEWLEWREDDEVVADESSRTFGFRVRIENVGNEAANNIAVSLDFPKDRFVSVINQFYVCGKRTICRPYPTYQNGRPATPPLTFKLPEYAGRPSDGAQPWGVRMSVDGLKFEHPQYVPDYKIDYQGTFYFTFVDWESVKPFEIKITARTVSPTTKVESKIIVKPILEDEDKGE